MKYEKYKDSGVEWIGEVPEHWEVMKLKYVANFYTGDSLNDEEKKIYVDCNITESLPYIGTKDVERDVNYINYNSGYCIPKNELDSFSIAPKGATLICIEGGSAGKKIGFVEQDVCFVNKLCCAKSFFEKSNKFLYFYFNSSLFTNQFNLFLQGLIGGVSINRIKCMNLLFPPLPEQQAIANYLDAKCAKINGSIDVQKRKIELLNELKQTIITDAVTKGLNPNAPMKNSGVEWIGEVPEHWEMRKIKHIGVAENGLTYKPTDICAEEEGVLVLRSSNIQNGKLTFDDNVYVNTAPISLKVKKGDIIICSRNGSASLVGKSAIVENDINATFGAFMMRFRSKHNYKYINYLLTATIRHYKELFTTTTINQLTIGIINSIAMPFIIDMKEQQTIVNYLETETSKIDAQIAKANRRIELLNELKQSIITEAVTGKIKVC